QQVIGTGAAAQAADLLRLIGDQVMPAGNDLLLQRAVPGFAHDDGVERGVVRKCRLGGHAISPQPLKGGPASASAGLASLISVSMRRPAKLTRGEMASLPCRGNPASARKQRRATRTGSPSIVRPWSGRAGDFPALRARTRWRIRPPT